MRVGGEGVEGMIDPSLVGLVIALGPVGIGRLGKRDQVGLAAAAGADDTT